MSSSITNKNAVAAMGITEANHLAVADAEARPVIDLRTAAKPGGPEDVAGRPPLQPAGESPAAYPATAIPARGFFSRVGVRGFDLAVAGTTLLMIAPALLVIAALVKVTSRGPVLYGSQRLASDKPTFTAWKFRSMHENADDRLAELLAVDREARTEYDLHRKLADDPRLTRLGRLLRVTSIDELPQLINILVGEMSVVGPRPKLLNERGFYGDQLPLVLSTKPGLTGLWQISGRSKLTMDERVALDVQYVMQRTFLGDLKICAVTAAQLLRPRRHGAT